MADTAWWQRTPSNPYGAYGGTYGSYHDTEQGNVYDVTPGAALGLPSAGTYDPGHSTQYSAVYDLPGGDVFNVIHIHNNLYGQTSPLAEPAGFAFATGDASLSDLGSYTGTTVDGKSAWFVQNSRHGTAIAEADVYDTPDHALYHDTSGTSVAPSGWPAIFARATAASGQGGAAPGPTPQPQPQWGGGNIPIVGGLGDGIGNVAGGIGGAAGNVGGAVTGVGSGIGGAISSLPRVGLTALFAIAALGLLFIVVTKLLGGGDNGASGARGGRRGVGRAARAVA